MRDTLQLLIGILWLILLVVVGIWVVTLVRLVTRAIVGRLREPDTSQLWRRFWLTLGLSIALAFVGVALGIAGGLAR